MRANSSREEVTFVPGSKTAEAAKGPRDWNRILAGYREPTLFRSIFELSVTAVPLALLWAAMWLSLGFSYWLCLLLAVPTGAFLVRLFMIQHDCGHGSFFLQRATNDWVGRCIGVFTLTPYGFWRRTHAAHHAAVGNLEERGTGDILTLTKAEFLALPRHRRLLYRLYRHPIVLFGIFPVFLFVIYNRVPVGFMRRGGQPWFSTMGTNAGIAALFGGMIWLMGIGPFLLVEAPIIIIAASIGMWFFYVQHQFEETSWAQNGEWTLQEAALYGSSHYRLPPPLAWLTGNIGVHHVHHLSSRIPCYRLPQVLRDYPELVNVGRISLLSSLKCAKLSIWDEAQQRLISFRELRAMRRAPS